TRAGGTVNCIAFDPRSRRLAFGEGRVAWVLDLRSLTPPVLRGIETPAPVSTLTFSRDSETLISGHDDGKLFRWDPASGLTRGFPLQGHRGGVSKVVLKPRSGALVSAGDDGTLVLWDLS